MNFSKTVEFAELYALEAHLLHVSDMRIDLYTEGFLGQVQRKMAEVKNEIEQECEENAVKKDK
jgi:hypothetical protein